jgi:hypothetical protein
MKEVGIMRWEGILGSKGWRRMWKLAVVGTQPLPLRLAGTFAESYYGRQILMAGTGTD